MTSHAAAKVGLKQETIAIVAVGVTMLGTMLFTTSRLEARIDRVQAETRAEARADREAFEARIDRVQVETRAEASADREAFEARIDQVQAEIRAEARADREVFSREIVRLTAGQSRLAGIVEGARTE